MRITLILLTFISTFFTVNSQNTVVNGSVLEAGNKSAIPYATVQFSFGSVGTVTDDYGRFLLESKNIVTEIKVSCVGYSTQTIKIKPNELNEVTILLKEINSELKEVTVRPEKYKRRNPASDLVAEVFKHRDQNRREGLNYYQYDNYEKLRFDLNGVTDKFKKKWYLRPFGFAFNFADTNKVNQKVALPFYFRERLLTSYFRHDPKAKKEKLWAERQTAFEDSYNVDKDGISTYLSSIYAEVDIYSPTILLLDKQFIGPLSAGAVNFYRFYITDTVKVDSQRFASVYFSPINKNDLAFMGTMLVSLDGSYAVQSIDMGISNDINVNWVKDIKIRQYFTFQGTDSTSRRLLLDHDELFFDFKIWKNKEGRSLLVNKRNYYKNYILNQPQPDTLYKSKAELIQDTGKIARTPQYWASHRFEPISLKEYRVKVMLDSLKQMKLVKRLTIFTSILASGYLTLGAIQLGNFGAPFRFNQVEGFRPQVYFRTNDRYFPKVRFRGYTAYGTRDNKLKYGGNVTYAFNGARPGRFPVNQVKFTYEHDLFFPGTSANVEQAFISSIQAGPTNRLLLHDITNLEYSKEYRDDGISFTLSALRKVVSERGIARDPGANNKTITTELGGWFRYAPNEKVYQGSNRRRTIRSKFPVFLLQYKAGVKDLLGGENAYQRASLRATKIFYLAPFGKTRSMAEAGAIFGQVPYPLLEIHRANQSYIFDDYGFNLMNYLEFVSDRYTMLHLDHDFGGIFLNRIPLIKKLHLREGVSFKALYGSLSERNTPSPSNGLIPFPLDRNKQPLTHGLGKVPYMETSVGVGNIFGVLRIDYIWRLNYNDTHNRQKSGVKMILNLEF